MKIVEGHLAMLRMYRDMSALSHSLSSTTFRTYIDMLERAVESGFGDIVPRNVDVHPAVDAEGRMSSKWIIPDAETGRIVSKNS